MVDLATISDKVDIAKSYYLELIEDHRQELIIGCDDCVDQKAECLKWLITALEFDITDQYNTDLTQINYKNLLDALVGFSGSYTYDPNVIIPGQSITINSDGFVDITRSEVSLLQDLNSQWYLPLIDDLGDDVTNATAAFVLYNGLSLPGAQLDALSTPNRIYGFLDNSAASIKVTYKI